jgi:hypothetical protein
MAEVTVSRYEREAFGLTTGPRLKRAPGSLHWIQLERLNGSAGAGIEPATR